MTQPLSLKRRSNLSLQRAGGVGGAVLCSLDAAQRRQQSGPDLPPELRTFSRRTRFLVASQQSPAECSTRREYRDQQQASPGWEERLLLSSC